MELKNICPAPWNSPHDCCPQHNIRLCCVWYDKTELGVNCCLAFCQPDLQVIFSWPVNEAPGRHELKKSRKRCMDGYKTSLDISRLILFTVLRRIASFRSTTDCIYDGRHISVLYYIILYYIILYYIILYCIIWYDMIWYDMIWYDMIWYDMIWYDMVWYFIILYYIILYYIILYYIILYYIILFEYLPLCYNCLQYSLQ